MEILLQLANNNKDSNNNNNSSHKINSKTSNNFNSFNKIVFLNNRTLYNNNPKIRRSSLEKQATKLK